MNPHETAAKQYLAAMDAKSASERALAVAKDLLIDASTKAGNPSVVVDGHAVTLTVAVRRSFATATLRGLVPETVYAATVKHSVDSRAFDRLVANGEIPGSAVTAVVTGTPYVRVNVTDATEATLVAVEDEAKAEPF